MRTKNISYFYPKQAEDIERHRDIRELERVKDDSVINANKFDLIHVSPFAVYRVSPKIIKSFEANQPIDKGKAKGTVTYWC